MAEFCPNALLFCSRGRLKSGGGEAKRGSGEALEVQTLAERGREFWKQFVP
jgi:hypothetical protein